MHINTLDLPQPTAWTLSELLSPGECATLIARIEALGPAPATIGDASPLGGVLAPDIRNNDRVIFDDVPLADELFARVREHVPSRLHGMTAIAANERLRCYRYRPGQHFAPHYDGCYERSTDERSQLTLMVYLNEDFEGGDTALLGFGRRVRPRTGMGLLFQHHTLHEGCVVRRGTKYALRSDVMYRRIVPR